MTKQNRRAVFPRKVQLLAESIRQPGRNVDWSDTGAEDSSLIDACRTSQNGHALEAATAQPRKFEDAFVVEGLKEILSIADINELSEREVRWF